MLGVCDKRYFWNDLKVYRQDAMTIDFIVICICLTPSKLVK